MSLASASAWNECLLVSRIISAMIQAENLSATITASVNDGFAWHTAAECRHAFGQIKQERNRPDMWGMGVSVRSIPEGLLMTELWRQLEAVREEWITLRMIAHGYERHWYNSIGTDQGRRASEFHRELDESAPTVERAIATFRERIRLRGSLAA